MQPAALRVPAVLANHLIALARRAAPLECVGFLTGPELGEIAEIHPLVNVAPDPTTAFRADPPGVVRALSVIARAGGMVVAVYHSHPAGGARPSRRDLELAAWDVPALIVDASSGEMRAFLLLDDARELPLVTH